MKKKFAILSLGLFTLAAFVSFFNFQNWANIPSPAPEILWWLFTFCVSGYAFYRRSLTTWILVSMVIGIQLGFQFKEFALELHVLSKIFLKLIKTIIGPILFATLDL
jgi:proton glutamate symport protein